MSNTIANKIVLGTVQFGMNYGISNVNGKTSKEEVKNVLDSAFKMGVKTLDTAQAYGNSELLLGELHQNRFQIITKINPKPKERKTGQLLLNQSLVNLKVKKIHGVLFHDAKSALSNPNIVNDLKILQEQGIIRELGYSVYTPKELQQLIQKYGKPDIIQIPFNHLDRRFEELGRKLNKEGVKIYARSTFLQGLYFVGTKELNNFFQPVQEYLKEIQEHFENDLQVIASTLLNFSLQQEFIDFVVLGVNNESQLIHNLENSILTDSNLPPVPKNIPQNILLPFLWPK